MLASTGRRVLSVSQRRQGVVAAGYARHRTVVVQTRSTPIARAVHTSTPSQRCLTRRRAQVRQSPSIASVNLPKQMLAKRHLRSSARVPQQGPSPLHTLDLTPYRIRTKELGIQVYRNAAIPLLYEMALKYEPTKTAMVDTGALVAYSGEKTGRSPSDKRIVDTPNESADVYWDSPACVKLPPHIFEINKERALDFLNTRERIFVVDAFAGWDPENRVKVRIICCRAYHALFMRNMLIRPTDEELKNFGEPDFVIYNAGEFPANRLTTGMTSKASVDLDLASGELVILGTQYAGEMKKSVFSLLHYLMPKKGHVSMHASANVGADGDVSLFFGLSGTGKTTLSADPGRGLIGDDEHVWTDKGVFNIEAGCYAKADHLSREREPMIFDAIKYGSVLENVIYDPDTRVVDYNDLSVTLNTRCCYPIEYIDNAVVPCVAGHPKNVIFLTCDAFGVLPPVSLLDANQASYQFMSGYTAKVAGTEMGVTEPEAAFSSCFGEAFLVWHPSKYATLLAQKMMKHGCKAWLVNTGWTGGAFGTGQRMSLKHTRALIDAIHDGSVMDAKFEETPVFKLKIPSSIKGVPDEVLNPRNTWSDKDAYDKQLRRLAELFRKNFKKFEKGTPKEIIDAGPQL